mmetsp:Transcript_130913/g.407106  ORF Transcript_130913/g.407106 Transcript_130913/m.407106 type:complete len:929 (-) Transcript_130913:763-3549(-)
MLDALLVSDGEPTHGSVLARLAPHAQARREGLFSRALDKLQDLVHFELSDLVVALILELPLQGNLLGALAAGPHDLVQVGRALVAAHCDPTLRAVCQRLAADPREPQLLVRHGPLQDLDDLVDLRISLDLRGADVELVGDCDDLHYEVELLHEGKELPLADSVRLYGPAKEHGVLRLQVEALEGAQPLAEGLLGDPLLPRLQELLEEALVRQALPSHLLAHRLRGLGIPGVHYGLAGGTDGVHHRRALLQRRGCLELELLQLPLDVHEGPPDGLADLCQLLFPQHPRRGDACARRGREGVDLPLQRGGRGEGFPLGALQARQRGCRLFQLLHALLHSLGLRVDLRLDGRRHLLLPNLYVRVLVELLPLGVVFLGHGSLLLDLLEIPGCGGHLHPQLHELLARLRHGRGLAGRGGELRALGLEEGGDLVGALDSLRDLLVHVRDEGFEGRDDLDVDRATIANHGDETRLVGVEDLALHARHARGLLQLGVPQRLQHVLWLDLRDGRARRDLEAIRHGDTLHADVARREDALERGKADRALSVRLQVLEDSKSPLLGDSQLLLVQGRGQALEVGEEGLLWHLAIGLPADLTEDGVGGEVLLTHVVPQAGRQLLHAGCDKEALATLVQERRAELRGLLDLLLQTLDHLAGLCEKLLGRDLLLPVTDSRLGLGDLHAGVREPRLQLLQRLHLGGRALGILLPGRDEDTRLVHLLIEALELGQELRAEFVRLLDRHFLHLALAEGLDGLCQSLALRLDRVDLHGRLLHLGGLLPALGVLAELAQLAGGGIDALGHLAKLLGGRLGHVLLELLHLEVLRGDVSSCLANGLLRGSSRSIALLEGLSGLCVRQELQAFEERELGPVHAFHGLFHLLRLLLSLLDVRLREYLLALVLGRCQDGVEFLLRLLAALYELLKGSLHGRDRTREVLVEARQ